MRNYCYATALTNEEYILGVKALAICLKKVKTIYPLVVFIPEDRFERIKSATIKENFLYNESNDTFKVIFKALPYLDSKQYGIDNKIFTNWNDSFFKLQSFLLNDYDKVILIDCDMLVIKNLDHLFDKPIYSAVNSGNAKWNGFKYLNSGLILIEPSDDVHNELIKLIPIAKKHKEDAGKNVGDQDVIREYLSAWPDNEELHLDEGYNLYVSHIKYYLKKHGKTNVKIIHFAGPIKPFNYSGITVIKHLLKSDCIFSFRMKILYFFRYKNKRTKVKCTCFSQ